MFVLNSALRIISDDFVDTIARLKYNSFHMQKSRSYREVNLQRNKVTNEGHAKSSIVSIDSVANTPSCYGVNQTVCIIARDNKELHRLEWRMIQTTP